MEEHPWCNGEVSNYKNGVFLPSKAKKAMLIPYLMILSIKQLNLQSGKAPLQPPTKMDQNGHDTHNMEKPDNTK